MFGLNAEIVWNFKIHIVISKFMQSWGKFLHVFII
jgi:hypothetical protein